MKQSGIEALPAVRRTSSSSHCREAAGRHFRRRAGAAAGSGRTAEGLAPGQLLADDEVARTRDPARVDQARVEARAPVATEPVVDVEAGDPGVRRGELDQVGE